MAILTVFFFDDAGQFVLGEYVVGLLGAIFLEKEEGSKIVHDPRVIWNTQDIVTRKGGVAVQSKTGHAFIKQTMRGPRAIYGGEMSAHHYFRDFAHCDSGMIPWLLAAELVSNLAARWRIGCVIALRHFQVQGRSIFLLRMWVPLLIAS
jgi:phosphomannomutase